MPQTATPAAKVTVRYFVLHEKRYSAQSGLRAVVSTGGPELLIDFR